MNSNTTHNPAEGRAKDRISAVPTNIITGFLGVGKTSSILQLLKAKPREERWAVLVNEFGEIGVDGALIQGQHPEAEQLFIREVPGGCMCCTSGLPMQIALNQLLRRAKPHRLLIEPTGLGHPIEVLEALSAEHYRDVLKIEKTLTLVDARKLSDSRYTEHAIFNQQIGIADIVVGNKQDLYEDKDRKALTNYVAAHAAPGTDYLFTEHGRIDIQLLNGATANTLGRSEDSQSPSGKHEAHEHGEASEHENGHGHEHKHHHHAEDAEPNMASTNAVLPEGGHLRAINQGEGFHSIGWRFDPVKTFNYAKLFVFLSGIQAERMKAVFITEQGIFGYNLSSGTLSEMPLDECSESRIEIISIEKNDDIHQEWERSLLSCAELC